MALTECQKKFVDEYLLDLNSTRAYKAAYPNVVKDETAAAAGARLLRNVKVSEYLAKRMKDRERRTEITQDKVLNELAAIAFANASDYAKVIEKQAVFTTDEGICIPMVDVKGKPVMVNAVELELTNNLSPEQKKALSGIKQGKHGVEVAACDKVKALELLGRHLGLFKDKVEVSGIEGEMSKLDDLIKQMNGQGG